MFEQSLLRRFLSVAFVSCCVYAGIDLPLAMGDDETAGETPQAFLQQFCLDCHGADDPAGERDFSELDLHKAHPDTVMMVQEIVDQLSLEEMPPEDAELPSADQRRDAIQALTGQLRRLRAELQSTGGQTVLRRLNRREYLATVGDLLGIDMTMFDPTVNFPRDNVVQQMDNVGDALVTSGYLLEQYLNAADAVVEKAFRWQQQPEEKMWTFDGDFYQQPELRTGHKEAFDHRYLCLYDNPLAERPEGAYGPLRNLHEGVHADGIYEIRVLAHAMNRDTPYDEKLMRISLDEPFRLGVVPGNAAIEEAHTIQPIQPLLAETKVGDGDPQWYTFRVPMDRGYAPRFVFPNGMQEARPTWGRLMRKYRDTLPKQARKAKGIFRERIAMIHYGKVPHIRVHKVIVRGPIVDQWPSPTRQQLLGAPEFQAENVPEILKRFADRAYRRPATDDEVSRLVSLYGRRVDQGATPYQAMKDAMKAALCSPAFLYFQPGADQDDQLSAHALASRLSYFLIGSMPDAALRRAADSGELLQPNVLVAHTRRLLADPRSDAFVAGFTDSWLNLRALGEMPPDRGDFSEYYSRGLGDEMKTETRLFTRHLIDQNLSILDFLRADYSFINRDLAKLYEVPDAVSPEQASEFKKVSFDDPRRGGLLGQASVLTVSANGIETSPVVRGIWLLENVLGTPPPIPPDDVPPIDPDVRGAKSIRDLLEKHRTIESCNACHRKIDPLGFALECFDPIGGMRNRYPNKAAIDTSGQLPGGQQFDDIAGLKQILLQRREFFARMMASRLSAYALGRQIEPSDRGEIDQMISRVAEDEYPMRSLIEQVVLSDLFKRR